MRRLTILSLSVLMLLCAAPVTYAQLKYEWKPVQIDSTWDTGKDMTANKIISKYEPMVTPLMEIVGYSAAEYSKERPESELSDFTADILRESAADAVGYNIDLAMMNFGRIRTSLPKGAVRVYDIMSIFPFNNYIVVLDVKGSDLKEIFNSMVQHRRYEVYSNVKMITENNKIVKLEVGGAPIKDNKIYKLATLDFIYQGGDSFGLKGMTGNPVSTDILVRDAVARYISKMTERGETIKLKDENRVQIKDWK